MIVDEVRCDYLRPQSTFTVDELDPIHLAGSRALALVEHGAGPEAQESILKRANLASRLLLDVAKPEHLKPLLASSSGDDRAWGMKHVPLVKA